MEENKKITGKDEVVSHRDSRVLVVSSEEDVKIMASPQRQRIFKLLHLEREPLHGKEIAKRLGIKPASAHYHLKKLERIGAVKQSHTEVINGITAKYYEAAVDSYILDEDFIKESDSDVMKEKLLMLRSTFDEYRDGFLSALHQRMKEEKEEKDNKEKLHLILDYIIYLSKEDQKRFQEEVQELFSKYTQPVSGKKPYSLLFSIHGKEDK